MVFFLSKKIDSNHLLFLEKSQTADYIWSFHSIISTPQKKDDYFLRRGSNPRPSSSTI